MNRVDHVVGIISGFSNEEMSNLFLKLKGLISAVSVATEFELKQSREKIRATIC